MFYLFKTHPFYSQNKNASNHKGSKILCVGYTCFVFYSLCTTPGKSSTRDVCCIFEHSNPREVGPPSPNTKHSKQIKNSDLEELGTPPT